MTITGRSLAAILTGLLLWGCHRRAPPAFWIDPGRAPSPVRLIGGDCLDLRKLPQGWKVASYSTSTWATFGIPGAVTRYGDVHYDLLVDAGAEGSGNLADYRTYVEGWAQHPRPSPHVAAWDVPGFEAYPADDGEIVYVGKGVDALMECSRGPLGCNVHDGISRHPIALNVEFGFDGRQNAAKKLDFARRLLNDLKVRC